VPGVFTESRNFMTPDETGYSYKFEQQKFMCNVGSVGQPRDGDPRSCYVIQEPTQLTFRRVEYDPTITAEKIYNIPDLDDFLGDRIKQGR
jgi:diadenosine tetraphosphatase ApaH/serine/threonine PP2A family protein phosphatase